MNIGQRVTTGTTAGYRLTQPYNTIQCIVTGTNAVAATVDVEVSNNNTHWTKHGTTQTLSGTNSAAGLVPLTAFFSFVRLNVTALSGTGATVVGVVASAG